MKKTEVLMENFRRAIALRIREKKEMYEGEVNPSTQLSFLLVEFYLTSLHPNAGHEIVA